MKELQEKHLLSLLTQIMSLRNEHIESNQYNPYHTIGFVCGIASVAQFMQFDDALKGSKMILQELEKDKDMFIAREAVFTIREAYSFAADQLHAKAKFIMSMDIPHEEEKNCFYLGIMSCVVELLNRSDREKDADAINKSVIAFLSSHGIEDDRVLQ